MIFERFLSGLARSLRVEPGNKSRRSVPAGDARSREDGISAASDAGNGSSHSACSISSRTETAPDSGDTRLETAELGSSSGFAGFEMVRPEEIMAASEDQIAELAEAAGADGGFLRDYLRPLLLSYASYAHLLPASERNHHRGPGGLFRHGLETAMLAVQMSRGLVLDRSAMPGRRRDMEFRWRVGYLTAGLVHDIGKPVSDMIIRSADGRSTWNPFVCSLYEWGCENSVDRYYPEWISGRFRRHEQLNLMALDLVLTREIRGFLSPGADRDILVALYNLATGNLLATPMGRIVTMADQESARRDLASRRLDASDLATCIPAERYILEAVIRLMDSGAWTVNRPGARVWVLDSGTYILWRCAGSISQILDQMRIPAVPRDPEELALILLERGYAEYRWEEQEDGDPARLKYFRIMPDIENPTEIDALKLSDGAFIFPRIMPPAIHDLLYDRRGSSPESDPALGNVRGAKQAAAGGLSAYGSGACSGAARNEAGAEEKPGGATGAALSASGAHDDRVKKTCAGIPAHSAAGGAFHAADSEADADTDTDTDTDADVFDRSQKRRNDPPWSGDTCGCKEKTLAPGLRGETVAAVRGENESQTPDVEPRDCFTAALPGERKTPADTAPHGVSDPLSLFNPKNFVRKGTTKGEFLALDIRLPEPGDQEADHGLAETEHGREVRREPAAEQKPGSCQSRRGFADPASGATEHRAGGFGDARPGGNDIGIPASRNGSPEPALTFSEVPLVQGGLSDGDPDSREDGEEMDFADFSRINPDLAETLLADDGSPDKGDNEAEKGKSAVKSGKGRSAGKEGDGARKSGSRSAGRKKVAGENAAGQRKPSEGRMKTSEANAAGLKNAVEERAYDGKSPGGKISSGGGGGNSNGGETRAAGREKTLSPGHEEERVSAEETSAGGDGAADPGGDKACRSEALHGTIPKAGGETIPAKDGLQNRQRSDPGPWGGEKPGGDEDGKDEDGEAGSESGAPGDNGIVLRFPGIAVPADSGHAARFLFALARDLASGRRICGIATNTRRIILTGGLLFDGRGELYRQLAEEKIAEARQGELVKLNLKWSRYLEAAMKASGREPARLPANIMSNLKISARFADLAPRAVTAPPARTEATEPSERQAGTDQAEFLRDFSPSAFGSGALAAILADPLPMGHEGSCSDLLPSLPGSGASAPVNSPDFSSAAEENSGDVPENVFSALRNFRGAPEADGVNDAPDERSRGGRRAPGAKMLEADRCLSDLREQLAEGEISDAVITPRGTEISVESFFDFMTRRWPALEKYETLGYLGSSRIPSGRDFRFRLGQVILRRREA